ncbi:MAG: CoA-binding protein [Ignavibacteriae bacterium]|nr:CoA-binding protein [Ignavibacteriota bacterium]
MNTQTLIREFLEGKRFAMPGVSRDSKHFSRMLYKEFLTRGYEVLPVNPLATEIDGKKCYARISEIQPPVAAALFMTPKGGTLPLLQECAESGISLVWFYGISGIKDVHPDAIRSCQQLGINHIAGYCPFMFLPSASFFHRLHGTVWKVLGKYPQ